jgi:hypothetical protein
MKLRLMLLSVIALQQISGGGGGHDPIERRQNWILVALAILAIAVATYFGLHH